MRYGHLIVLACLWGAPLLAGSHHGQHHQGELGRLLHIVHHAIAGPHRHFDSPMAFVKALGDAQERRLILRNLNFKKIAWRARRAYNIEENGGALAGHLKNLLLIFPLSHALEVSVSPLFASLGVGAGWPDWLVGAGTAGLSVIAVPGLDPLCLLIFASYPLPAVHKSISFVREKIERMLRLIPSGERVDQLERLRALKVAGLAFADHGEHLEVTLTDGDSSLVLQVVRESTGSPWLESVSFDANSDTTKFVRLARLFSANARYAIGEALREWPSELDKEFYVANVTEEGGLVRVTYKAKAISFAPVRKDCSGLLGGNHQFD